MPIKKSLGFLRFASGKAARSVEARNYKLAGDQARGKQNWAQAVSDYRAYLDHVSGDAPIWVQYGHALKENGDLAEAKLAYEHAVSLDPADTDVLLHLGHLLKRQGELHQAAEVFLELLARAPSAEAIRELQYCGYGHQALAAFGRPKGVVAGGIFIELSDLFQYLSHHVTVTGITRVTLGLLNYILNEMPSDSSARYYFVHQYGDGDGLLLIPREKMRKIVTGATQGTTDLAKMQALIEDIRSTSEVFRLSSGDCYLIVGAFWEFVSNPSWIGGMRQRGVFVGAYIYDLIPITHAQYCMHELTDAFSLAFADTARMLDFALTISAFVATEVQEYIEAHGIEPFPVTPIPLAHELRFEAEHVDAPVSQIGRVPKRQFLSGIPFVLCVCTIEARKNHDYLLTIWQRMLNAGLDVPDLVFVGRPGWRVEPLMMRITNSNHLNGRLHILNGLSDDELADLYDRCLFTAFPSYVEGWGLPVGESLAHGKICVASSASSIPEVGGSHALYFDPFDIDDGYAIISKLITDKKEFQRLETALQTEFKSRTWNDVGRDFFSTLSGFLTDLKSAEAPAERFVPFLDQGQMLDSTKLLLPNLAPDYALNPQRLMFATGWRPIESEGTWMLDPEAILILKSQCAPGTEVSIILHLGTSPWVGVQNVLSISADDPLPGSQPGYRRPLRSGVDMWITLKGRVNAQGVIKIRFEVEGNVQTPGDHIAVTLRVRGMGYAPFTDLQARVGLLEGALLT